MLIIEIKITFIKINHHHKNQHPSDQDHHHQFLGFSSLQLLSEQEPPQPPPFRSVTDTKTERAPQKLVSKSLRSCTAFFRWLLLRTCQKLFGSFFRKILAQNHFSKKSLAEMGDTPKKSAKFFREFFFPKRTMMFLY